MKVTKRKRNTRDLLNDHVQIFWNHSESNLSVICTPYNVQERIDFENDDRGKCDILRVIKEQVTIKLNKNYVHDKIKNQKNQMASSEKTIKDKIKGFKSEGPYS